MSTTIPVAVDDPTNARILSISEDRIAGFCADPIGQIARQSGVEPSIVTERISAMLRSGNIRRVRQTLLATSLAQGSLVAWLVSPEKLNSAFDWMFQHDPFSGHVVIRSTLAGDDPELLGTALCAQLLEEAGGASLLIEGRRR